MFTFIVMPALAQEFLPEKMFVIHQIVGSPVNANEVFAITSNYGVIKSTDAGATWTTASNGIKSFTHHTLAITPTAKPRIYIGEWGGGISSSDDNGATWTELNDQLGNTAIDALVVDPGSPGKSESPDRLYAATSTQFFRTDESGKKWVPFGDGLPPFPDEIKFKSLLLLPGPPKSLWLGNSQGLFHRDINAVSWSADEAFDNISVSSLAYDAQTRRMWVGTLKHGLFMRDDPNEKWVEMGSNKAYWINQIVPDPTDPQVIYIATRGSGVLKSTDGGKHWQPSNTGLDDLDVRSMAIHPLNHLLLFAGTTTLGVIRSTDGGAHWSAARPMPELTMPQIIEMLTVLTHTPATHLKVPDAMVKCNACHGWTDTLLNHKVTYWRVPPNQRDWSYTVGRMAQRAKLTETETFSVIDFLTAYSKEISAEPARQ
jgi:photosystem II stability/assembly factor-like uncharacterized protein